MAGGRKKDVTERKLDLVARAKKEKCWNGMVKLGYMGMSTNPANPSDSEWNLPVGNVLESSLLL